MMKAAVYVPIDIRQAGGVEIHILQMAKALRELSVDVTLFVKRGPELPYVRGCEEFDAGAFDIVHTHACFWDKVIYGISRGIAGKHVHTLHGVSWDYLRRCGAYFNWRCYTATLTEWYLARRSDAVICINRAIAKQVARWMGVPGDRVGVVYNGHDFAGQRVMARGEMREKLGFADEDVVCVFVGRGHDKVKGTDRITEAMTQLRERYEQLYLLAVPGTGFDEETQWLRRTGTVHYEELGSYYAASDLFINASRHEGLPLTLIEAMAAGLAVIAAPVGGIGEIIRHGENGLLLSRDGGDLAAHIEHLITHRDEAMRMGAAARDDAARLTWGALAKQTLAVYERVLS